MFDDSRPSKTRRKKDMHALQALGESLVELNAAQLQNIELPEALRHAIEEAQQLRKHEARRRQMQYIGRLMRSVDPAPIQAYLDSLAGQSATATAALHRVERWRDRLIEDDAAFTEFANSYPHADLQPLRASVREARKEHATNRPPRHYRELFRLIKAIDEARSGDEQV